MKKPSPIHGMEKIQNINPEGLPRVGGDLPATSYIEARESMVAPHGRGSALYLYSNIRFTNGCPAWAGICLQPAPASQKTWGLPRMGGGLP